MRVFDVKLRQYKSFVYENVHSSTRTFGLGSHNFKMSLNLHNFYHPYYNSSLEFLSFHDLDQTNMSEGEIVDEIDLYYQPLENPSIVITFFSIKILVICIGEAISTKLVASLSKEKALLTDITKFFIISQMILQPILVCLDLIINLIYPVNEIIGNWLCFLTWLLWGVFMRVGLNNSFVSALMRYFFIVHEKKVNEYGKEKIRRWFLYFSLVTPIIQFTLQALDGSPRLSFINKCYGNDHRVFLIEASTLNVFKAKFVKLDEHYVNINSIREITIRICKVIEAILFIFMGFNVTESFLYYKIFNKIDR